MDQKLQRICRGEDSSVVTTQRETSQSTGEKTHGYRVSYYKI